MSSDDRPILRLGHSPDPDDAFMWWPLFEADNQGTATAGPRSRPRPRIDTARSRFIAVPGDIESLNQRAAGDLAIGRFDDLAIEQRRPSGAIPTSRHLTTSPNRLIATSPDL